MLKTKQRLDKAQARYKKNFDKRLRKQYELVTKGNEVFLPVKRKSAKEHHHKLAPVAEGPFKVTKADNKTVVIQRSDRSVERVSRTRVVLDSKAMSKKDFEDIVKPAEEYLGDPADESANQKDLVKESRPKKTKNKMISESDSADTPGSIDHVKRRFQKRGTFAN